MATHLYGKTVLITGASAGIGYSTAIEFAKASPKNLKIIVTARRLDRLEECARDISSITGSGVKVLARQLDVANAKEVNDCIQSLPKEFSEIDILVNNA